MKELFVIVFLISVFIVIFYFYSRKSWKKITGKTDDRFKAVLRSKVAFYNALSNQEQQEFELRSREFLLNTKVTGINTKVNYEDKVLVSAGAIIPIFAFKDWRYNHLDEVLLYPSTFNQDFEQNGDKRNVLGMVGGGSLSNKMILSKNSLRHDFSAHNDSSNTTIHEFVHLIDKEDGVIDGVPKALMKYPEVLPWIDLMKRKVNEIKSGESDIKSYGGTSLTEFLPVASEYFFENPKSLKEKHPELYESMSKIFNQKMGKRHRVKLSKEIKRNDLCPCGSGEKFKRCCMRKYN